MSVNVSSRTLPRMAAHGSWARRPAKSPAPTRLITVPIAEQSRSVVKAAFDWVMAAIILVASLPILLVGMLAVRLSSPGPVIYTQSRVGRGGRVFTIYKLRTMYVDCESLTGPRWCVPGDPRITPVGLVLRRLHIDELPQLWNVLRGEMSLIGPRPERPEICAQLRRVIPGYDRRHVVQPGITGFAQIHLPPDTSIGSVRNKVAYDRFYIMRQNLWLELYILVCTALKVVGLRSLYERKPRRPADD
jgi:lipopolysaccharide/colanic/teichoic acid biosynthesis glycosyltransferase